MKLLEIEYQIAGRLINKKEYKFCRTTNYPDEP